MEQKNNSGALFKNDKKGNEKAPEYKDICVVDGIQKEVAAWVKEAKNGNKYLSLQFSEPFKKADNKGKYEQKDDDLPF
jgi:uncharacterized protein (DUF736 family)